MWFSGKISKLEFLPFFEKILRQLPRIFVKKSKKIVYYSVKLILQKNRLDRIYQRKNGAEYSTSCSGGSKAGFPTMMIRESQIYQCTQCSPLNNIADIQKFKDRAIHTGTQHFLDPPPSKCTNAQIHNLSKSDISFQLAPKRS